MARRNPLETIAHLAVDTVLHPIETTGKSVAIGRMVVGQVGRTAVSVAAETVNALLARRPDDHSPNPYSSHGGSASEPAPDSSSRADLRRVPPVNEPGHPPTPSAPGSTRRPGDPAAGAPLAVAVDAPAKQQGDPSTPLADPEARRAPSRKAAEPARVAKKAEPAGVAKAVDPAGTAKKADPAGTAKKAGQTGTAKRAAAKKAAAKKAPARPVTTAADAGEPPVATEGVSATPADVAPVAGTAAKAAKKSATKKSAAKKSAAKKSAANKSAANKSAGTKVAGKKVAGKKSAARKTVRPGEGTGPTPLSEQSADRSVTEPVASSGEDTLVFTSDSGDDSVTPVEERGGTDHLEQPLIDPGTADIVQSSLETGTAADPENG